MQQYWSPETTVIGSKQLGTETYIAGRKSIIEPSFPKVNLANKENVTIFKTILNSDPYARHLRSIP